MIQLEDHLSMQIRALGLPDPVREYRFHPVRRFRFDFAWPESMLAAEVDGATWANGRHNRGAGVETDCVKGNLAIKQGWRVLRFTGDMVKSGHAVSTIEEVLKGDAA